MQLSAREIAELLSGSVEGDSEVKVGRPSKIEEGGPGTIAFLGNEKYEPYAYTTTASVLLVDRNFRPRKPVSATLIRVADVYASIATLFEHFAEQLQPGAAAVVSESAAIDHSAELGPEVAVGDFCVIEAGVKIGRHSRIHPQVFIGKGAVIGESVTLFPGVRIMPGCRVGDRSVLHANVVIGSDGFGFAPQPNGTYQKVAQLGNVIVENDVEIGANTTIDRATLGSTIIRAGVKLDNLIQVGHNVEIGENTVIAAQAGIAGSTKIGKNCRIGGQVGFVGHIKIADGVQIQAQSGIASSVETPGQALFGSPAIEYNNYLRSFAVFKQLPALWRRLQKLERQQKEK